MLVDYFKLVFLMRGNVGRLFSKQTAVKRSFIGWRCLLFFAVFNKRKGIEPKFSVQHRIQFSSWAQNIIN